ncbi:hypothetical protein [Negadavirga shengliensis]|uniref:Uncharacterized protein n=1 Tax=Negadavirga shengliensis TaxID=1389218 RepID=A0ABV9SVC2_9BACT
MIKIIINLVFSINILFIQNSIEFFYKNDGIKEAAELSEYSNDDLEKYALNKEIPDAIREVTLEALSYFPDLLDIKIDFQFKNRISGSVMQAQPKIGSLILNKKENRAYKIKISRYLELEDEAVLIEELPHDVLLGWIGHELGHIKDYLERSALNMMGFGIQYYCSDNFVTEAEIAADSHAVAYGLGKKIIATKNFVLNHDRLPDDYKNKIKTLYMSPGEILSLVEVQEDDEQDQDGSSR